MKIRYIVSMGGVDRDYPANEKDKSGKYIWYNVADYEAVRLVDADIAVYSEKAEYEKAKSNYAALEAQKKQQHELKETLDNLGNLKNELQDKTKVYKSLGVEIKELDGKIRAAEATVTPKAEA